MEADSQSHSIFSEVRERRSRSSRLLQLAREQGFLDEEIVPSEEEQMPESVLSPVLEIPADPIEETVRLESEELCEESLEEDSAVVIGEDPAVEEASSEDEDLVVQSEAPASDTAEEAVIADWKTEEALESLEASEAAMLPVDETEPAESVSPEAAEALQGEDTDSGEEEDTSAMPEDFGEPDGTLEDEERSIVSFARFEEDPMRPVDPSDREFAEGDVGLEDEISANAADDCAGEEGSSTDEILVEDAALPAVESVAQDEFSDTDKAVLETSSEATLPDSEAVGADLDFEPKLADEISSSESSVGVGDVTEESEEAAPLTAEERIAASQSPLSEEPEAPEVRLEEMIARGLVDQIGDVVDIQRLPKTRPSRVLSKVTKAQASDAKDASSPKIPGPPEKPVSESVSKPVSAPVKAKKEEEPSAGVPKKKKRVSLLDSYFKGL